HGVVCGELLLETLHHAPRVAHHERRSDDVAEAPAEAAAVAVHGERDDGDGFAAALLCELEIGGASAAAGDEGEGEDEGEGAGDLLHGSWYRAQTYLRRVQSYSPS